MRGAFALSPGYCSGFISLSAYMHISLTGSSQVSCPPSVGNLFKWTDCVDEIQNRVSFCCSWILSIVLVFIYRQKLQRTRWSEWEMAEESRPVNFSYATWEIKNTQLDFLWTNFFLVSSCSMFDSLPKWGYGFTHHRVLYCLIATNSQVHSKKKKMDYNEPLYIYLRRTHFYIIVLCHWHIKA